MYWMRGTPFASSKSIPGASGKQPTKHVPPRVSQITWNATYARAVKPQDTVFNVNQGTLLEPMVDLFICITCLVISGIVAISKGSTLFYYARVFTPSSKWRSYY